jgi:anti-sigma factor RsiW
MTCQQFQNERLLDQEEGTLSREANLHLLVCSMCQAHQKEERRLRFELRRLANSEHAPIALRQSIAAMCQGPRTTRTNRGANSRRWMAVAATILLLVGATLGIVFERHTRAPSPERLAQAFVTDHLEYLPGREQITSDSPRQAEEWLHCRIDFPVHVPKVPGTVLETACICDVSGRKAALLQYHHIYSNTLISLFVTTEPRAYEREKMPVSVETSGNGLRSKLWCHRGLVYDVVAQVDESSLKQIADAVRTQEP